MAESVSEIALEDSIELKGYFHAAHCMFWAPWDHKVFGKHETKAAVVMQVRFDGAKGFIGGQVEKDGKCASCPEDIVDALNRELVEEANLDLGKHVVKAENHLISYVQHEKKFVAHLYALKVSIEDLKEIEKRIFDAEDYGDEVFGTLRVPLYTMEDGKGGLPTFLKNVFAGIAQKQLLYALKTLKLMSDEEINAAVKISKGDNI